MGKIVACGGFAGLAAGPDDFTVGQYNLQRQDIFAHRAVAQRICAGGSGRRHATDGGICPRINCEHQTRGAQFGVQLLAGDPRLHNRIEILIADLQHLVHPTGIDADAAVDGHDMTL